jgi:biofilm PGA synthesis N-glycosyltransferase PgaC
VSALGALFWGSAGAIAYTYAGYPLALAALAERRRRRAVAPESHTPERRGADGPSATILIAAHDEAEAIGEKLRNTLSLDAPAGRVEVIVVEDGSTDGTADIVRSWGDSVRLVSRSGRRGKSAALNAGVALATGDVVVFSDANNLYERSALVHLLAPFTDPRVGAVTGAKHIAGGPGGLSGGESLYWRYEAAIRRHESTLGCCTGVNGEILAMRRELVEPIPDDVINDDFWLAMRVARRGYDVVYEPLARSWEPTSASAGDEIQRRSRIVAGRYQALSRCRHLLTWRRPLVAWAVASHKFLRPLVPLAAGIALVANAVIVARRVAGRPTGGGVIALGRPAGELALAAQGGFYAAAMLGRRLEGTSGPVRVLYLPAFLVDSNRAALNGLVRFVRGTGNRWRRVERSTAAAGPHTGATAVPPASAR